MAPLLGSVNTPTNGRHLGPATSLNLDRSLGNERSWLAPALVFTRPAGTARRVTGITASHLHDAYIDCSLMLLQFGVVLDNDGWQLSLRLLETHFRYQSLINDVYGTATMAKCASKKPPAVNPLLLLQRHGDCLRIIHNPSRTAALPVCRA